MDILKLLELAPDKVTLLLFLLIPGFISIKVYDLQIPGRYRDFSKSILEIIVYSIVNLAIFIPLFYLFLLIFPSQLVESSIFKFIIVYIFIFITPIMWPCLLLKLYSFGIIKNRVLNPAPTAWDAIFLSKKVFWVIVYLKDGREIGGLYGKNSFASSYPNEEQIYLEEAWELEDRKFSKRVDRTGGIFLFKSEILGLEFFCGMENEKNQCIKDDTDNKSKTKTKKRRKGKKR